MNKTGFWIVFIVALIVGLSLGFIVGIGTSLYAAASFTERIIETNGITIVFDINETATADYIMGLVNSSIEAEKNEIIMEFG